MVSYDGGKSYGEAINFVALKYYTSRLCRIIDQQKRERDAVMLSLKEIDGDLVALRGGDFNAGLLDRLKDFDCSLPVKDSDCVSDGNIIYIIG